MSLDKQFEEMVDKAVSEKLTATPPTKTTKEKKKTQTGDDYWTFSKIITTLILAWSIGCVSLSYIFGWCGVESVLESLSERHLIVIVGVYFADRLKSFAETREKENVKLEYAKMERADGSPTKEDNVAG